MCNILPGMTDLHTTINNTKGKGKMVKSKVLLCSAGFGFESTNLKYIIKTVWLCIAAVLISAGSASFQTRGWRRSAGRLVQQPEPASLPARFM